jgi:UDP-N-acetyl-2-amino-2-deoxyglucuronate dehydrogenase
MKNFALTGLAGYIAPRHLQAIKDTGNVLVAAVDPNDSVGIVDTYYPDAAFFTEFERFDRHLEKLRRSNSGEQVDYISICSPNNLHDAHMRLALRLDAHAICEKPLVMNPWNLDLLQELEAESAGRIFTVLQLRLHPSLVALREKIQAAPKDRRYTVRLTYLTGRGKWYHYSWKGDEERSGGVATNIGVHFFDLLIWLFGPVKEQEIYIKTKERVGGFVSLERADVEWFLSIDIGDVPQKGKEFIRTYRSITIDGEEMEFSGGFTDLHTRVYEDVLAGGGFGIEDARPSIEMVHTIRSVRHPLGKPVHGSLHPHIAKLGPID